MVSAKLLLSVAASLSGLAQAYVIKVDSQDGSLRRYDVNSGNLTAEEFLRSREPVHFRRKLEERQEACFIREDYFYEIVGNGNPHQNYKIAQVADTLITCSKGAVTLTGREHTFSWSVGGGIEVGHSFAFANFGFSVGESDSKSVQQSFTCGENGMTEICVMHYTAVTAITVHFYKTTTGCQDQTTEDLGEGVVYLPNANGIGSTIARGTNFGRRNIIQCRGQAARELNFYCGPPGGPDWFDTHEYGPWSEAYMSSFDQASCAVPIEAFKFED